jgi:photosystem II stability/assembly factor-like uncharacterized protein
LPVENDNTRQLNKLNIVDSMTVYAVGDSGTILQSIDAGINWITLESPVSVDFYGLYFVSSDTGWVVGGFQHILRTVNGGESWEIQKSYDQSWYTFYDIYFKNSSVGWVVGSGSNDNVFYTEDGGQNWNFQSSSNGSMKDIFFINESVGWIIDNDNVLFTEDGGSNWWEQDGFAMPQNHSLRGVFFTDINSGFIIGDFGLMFQTMDGGWTWDTVDDIIYPTKNANDIYFNSEDTGFVTTSGTSADIYMTNDGGLNWTRKHYASHVIRYNDIENVNEDVSYVVGTGGAITYTSDGGDNWVDRSIDNSSPHSNREIKKSSFINQSEGWILLTYNGVILHTLDSALNWNEIKTGASNDVIDIKLFSNQLGYALTQNEFLATVDGGTSWVILDSLINIQPGAFKSFYFVDENNIFIVSDDKLLKSNNGGINWQLFDFGYDRVTKILFVDNENGWAIGFDGLVLQTINGGERWSKINSHSRQHYLNNIYFLNSASGWIAGGDATILAYNTSDPTSINNKLKEDIIVPEAFLHQNYPNPFNPVTKITFELSKTEWVTINIFNIAGQKIKTLVNQNFSAGRHTLIYDGSGFATGLYYYKIITRNFTDVKKMLLIK